MLMEIKKVNKNYSDYILNFGLSKVCFIFIILKMYNKFIMYKYIKFYNKFLF